MKLDRNSFRTYNFSNQPKDSEAYSNLTQSEIAEVFCFLMQQAYGSKFESRMDRTAFSMR
jgi:hypothetical protein